jgi:transketolase
VEDFQKDNPAGRYIRYGVREHAMGAIVNGISVTEPLRAYSATFMSFADYMRPPIRLAAMSHYPSIFVFTHDSIGVGEDGPTHQPVEQLASLRAIPNLVEFRPADANETAAVWKYTIEHNDRPVTMMLTRQGLPTMDQDKYATADVEKGAYTLIKADNPAVLLLATGSEVHLAVEAAKQLADDGIAASVVSMPSWRLFAEQDQAYQQSVIPSEVTARVGVEAGIRQGWDRWLGDKGIFIGMDEFGISAPAAKCFEHFGITVENIVKAAKKAIG